MTIKDQYKAKVLNPINEAGFKAYFVGGCVRDFLMGVEPHDYDICTTATPEELHKIFDKFSNVSSNSEPFGVTMPLIEIDGKFEEVEIATLRKDITKGRHPKIEFTRDIKEDAERRDFTVNALYEDIDGFIFDMVGGAQDIKNRTLRFVGNAQDRINEDPLRIFRFVRFLASKGFKSAYTKREVLDWNFSFTEVSAERQLKELEKTFAGKFLFPDTWEFVLAARVLTPLGLTSIMIDLRNVVQSWMWHSEGSTWTKDGKEFKGDEITDFDGFVPATHGTAWDHTLIVMKRMAELSKDLDEHTRFVMMMAAFLHDIGKAHSQLGLKTNTFKIGSNEFTETIPKVSDHDVIGAPIAYDICKSIGMTNDDSETVRELVRLHMRAHQLGDMKSKKAVWEITSNPVFDKLIMLAKADESACIKSVTDAWVGIEKSLEKPMIQSVIGKPMPKPIITGQFLIDKGRKPGPKFKHILDVALKMQIDKDMTDAEAIYKIVKGC